MRTPVESHTKNCHSLKEVNLAPLSISIRTFFSVLLMCLACSNAVAQTGGTVAQVVVHGQSLENNLNGDSPDREVYVYLPQGYETNPDKRYPVVYMLHGYGLQAERWMDFAGIEAGANTAMTGREDGAGAAGRIQKMIVVSPDTFNRYDGSMYGSSVATGDWETFIADELVTYIDGNFRTLAQRESRGLAGHSMGGYGTLRIGMKRPDVFSALYPMSACCMFDAGEPSEAMRQATQYKTREDVAALRFPDKSTLARAASWSPNLQNPPLYLDLPVVDGVAQPHIQAKWLANSILAMLDQYTLNLRRYTAIKFDVGTGDSLLDINARLDAAMTAAGIAHTYETYEGDHNNKVAERIETAVLPFFSTHLQGSN